VAIIATLWCGVVSERREAEWLQRANVDWFLAGITPGDASAITENVFVVAVTFVVAYPLDGTACEPTDLHGFGERLVVTLHRAVAADRLAQKLLDGGVEAAETANIADAFEFGLQCLADRECGRHR